METDYQLALAYQPHIRKDLKEPFPIRYFGYTVFRDRGGSQSFKELILDPKEQKAEYIIEYAIYYDYDIQHLYDLEHVWVAVDRSGTVAGCWSSFHGMRLRDHRIAGFRLEGDHPVLYAQPGKHALLPDPALFWLHQDFPECCGPKSGGGLLVPSMLADAMETDDAQDRIVCQHIQRKYAFTPALEYEPETVGPEQIIPWSELKAKIPELVREELVRIRQEENL